MCGRSGLSSIVASFDAEEYRGFSLRLLVVEKAILAKEGDVAEAKGAAAIEDDRIERIARVAFPYASAIHPWHSHPDGKIVRQAVGDDSRDAFDRFEWTPSLPVTAGVAPAQRCARQSASVRGAQRPGSGCKLRRPP